MDTIDTNIMLATADIADSLKKTRSKNIIAMTLTALRINLPTLSLSTTTTSSSSSSSSSISATSSSSAAAVIPEKNRNTTIFPEISLKEVAFHDCSNDCWIVLYDRVYDVTKFLDKHPGGEEIILEYAGRDATLAFRGTGHSKLALTQLHEYLIGELPSHQRIYRADHQNGISNKSNTGSILLRLSDIPD